MTIPNQPTFVTPPAKVTPSAPAPQAKTPKAPEPTTQVAPAYTFKDDMANKLVMPKELAEALRGPGDKLNLSSGKKFNQIRSQLDLGQAYEGIQATRGQMATATDIPNPDSPDGQWDPTAFMPRFAFDPQEDAFPIAPDFDGDQDLANNGPVEANGTGGNYEDGVIGGDQPLSGAFSVTKKGDYTVLTYSMYSAHNKAVHYHNNDYSTAQVYLKPGPDGKLQPEFLSTSWHHGSVLTKWDDLAKDDQGRPVVQVHRGSHALQAVGEGDDIPTDGLQIAGDGSVSLNGKPLPNKMGFEAFQTNVQGATYKDPKSPDSAARLEAMRWGEAALNPFLPEVYQDAKNPLVEMGERYVGGAIDKAEKEITKVVDQVEEAAEDVVDTAENVVDKVEDMAGDAVDTGKNLFKKLPFV